MLTNDQMIAGRFLRWHKARKRVAAIQSALAAGRAVCIGSYTRPTVYRGASHVESFKATRTGSYVRRGKGWDCIVFSPIGFGA